MKSNKNSFFFTVLLILAMTSWGASWAIAKLITDSVSHEIIIFWRFFITSVTMIPIVILAKGSFKINIKGLIQVILGALFLLAYNLCFFGGVEKGLSGVGGVFVTTLNPLLTFLLTSILFKQSIKLKDYIGLGFGLIGGLIVMRVWELGYSSLFSSGNLFFILAALSWASLSVVSHKSKTNMNSFVFSFYTYFLAALFAFILGIPKGVLSISQITPMVWYDILYLSIGATTFGTTAYFYAVSKLGPNRASSFMFIVPSSAVLFSFWLVNEQPTIYTMIGGVIALIAVYLVNLKSKKAKACN